MEEAPQSPSFEPDDEPQPRAKPRPVPQLDPEPEAVEEEAFTIDPALRRFYDLPIKVRIELDRKRITLGEALSLREQMVIALERSAGENVDLLLDGMRVGNGEIVVIEDTMGLRLTGLRRDVAEERD